jgi:hypothetical protein
VEKVAQQFGPLLKFSKKTAQNKQSPNRRKFAQSGHPGWHCLHARLVGLGGRKDTSVPLCHTIPLQKLLVKLETD